MAISPNSNYNGSNFDHDARTRKQKELNDKTIIDNILDNNNGGGANVRLNEIEPIVEDLKVQYGESIKGELSFYDGTNSDGVNQILQYQQNQDIGVYFDNGNKFRKYPWSYHDPLVYLLELSADGNDRLSGGHIDATHFANATNIAQINRMGVPLNNNNLIGTYGKLNMRTMVYSHGDKNIFEAISIPNYNQYFSAYTVTETDKTTPITYSFVGPLENNKIPSSNAGKYFVTFFFDIESGAIAGQFIHEFDNPLNEHALQQSHKLVYNFTPEMKAKVTSGKYGRYLINTDHLFTISVKNPFNPDDKQEWETEEGQLAVDTVAIKYDKESKNTLFNDGVGNKDITLASLVKGGGSFIKHKKVSAFKHEWYLTNGVDNEVEILIASALVQGGVSYLTTHQGEVKIKSPDSTLNELIKDEKAKNNELYEHTLTNIEYGDGPNKGKSYLNINNTNGTGATYNCDIKETEIKLGNGTILK